MKVREKKRGKEEQWQKMTNEKQKQRRAKRKSVQKDSKEERKKIELANTIEANGRKKIIQKEIKGSREYRKGKRIE